ncbi:MAG: hypothetical protein A2W64_03345 [Candidatus Zambryskibacteria bacterium RIFCSPLOWO2_02_39_10]|nr:MAG: hypothetical protein A2W64_03345 [Candidatus Zambryskibacteria bacterium RIFCSPLOWO2_02_39_10]
MAPLTEAVHLSHFDYKILKVLQSRNTAYHLGSKMKKITFSFCSLYVGHETFYGLKYIHNV